MYGHDINTIRCYLTRERRICMVYELGSQQFSKYLGTSCLRGTVTLRMAMTYMSSDAPWHKEQEYIQFRYGKFKCFKDIRKFPLFCPHPIRGTMTLTNVRLYYVWQLLWAFWAHCFLRSFIHVPYIRTRQYSIPYCGPTPTTGAMILTNMLLKYSRKF
jgi:hypothetical protein